MAPTSLPSVSATTSSTSGAPRSGESASNGNLFAELLANSGKLARTQETQAASSESAGDTGEGSASIQDLEQMLAALEAAPDGDELSQRLEALLDRKAGLDGSTESAENGDPGELLENLLAEIQGTSPQDGDTLAALRQDLKEQDGLDEIRERLDAIAGALGQAPQVQPLSQAIARATQASAVNSGNAQGPSTPAMLLATNVTGSDNGASATLDGNTSNAASGRSLHDFTQSLQTTNSASTATLQPGQDASANTALLSAQFEASEASGKGLEPTGKAGGDAVSPSLLATNASNHAGVQAGNGFAPSPAAATGSMASATLTAPLGSGEWQQSLGQQLVNLHQRGDQQVQLHLHPAELGPLSVHLKVDDQLAQAQFLSTNPHVRAAVEQALPQLRAALGEAGIQLGETMVGDQAQQQQSENGDGNSRGFAQSSSLAFDGDSIESLGMPMTPLTLESSGVDLYA